MYAGTLVPAVEAAVTAAEPIINVAPLTSAVIEQEAKPAPNNVVNNVNTGALPNVAISSTETDTDTVDCGSTVEQAGAENPIIETPSSPVSATFAQAVAGSVVTPLVDSGNEEVKVEAEAILESLPGPVTASASDAVTAVVALLPAIPVQAETPGPPTASAFDVIASSVFLNAKAFIAKYSGKTSPAESKLTQDVAKVVDNIVAMEETIDTAIAPVEAFPRPVVPTQDVPMATVASSVNMDLDSNNGYSADELYADDLERLRMENSVVPAVEEVPILMEPVAAVPVVTAPKAVVEQEGARSQAAVHLATGTEELDLESPSSASETPILLSSSLLATSPCVTPPDLKARVASSMEAEATAASVAANETVEATSSGVSEAQVTREAEIELLNSPTQAVQPAPGTVSASLTPAEKLALIVSSVNWNDGALSFFWPACC